MRVRRSILFLTVLSAVSLLALPVNAATPSGSAGRFIVTLRDGVDANATAAEYRGRDNAQVDYVYTAALNGFAGDFSSGALGRLEADGRVARIERDGVVHATADTTQSGATWGIDRIDQAALPLSGTYGYATTASNVRAYIIDTGIRASHADLGGRVVSGSTSITDGRGTDDCNGHGTHVSGTVGGATYGVAKGVTLVPVRVLDCQGTGSWSGVIAGLDWVTTDHAPGAPAVANMSLGGGAFSTLDDAVRRAIADGVTFAVAAGNSSANACNYSPARVAEALTVGATTSGDVQASYSNYGTCVDLNAPGSSITSDWNASDTATNTISGTSMATPHVTGAAALYLAANPTAAPATVAGAIVNGATVGALAGTGSGTPNFLLRVNSPAPTGPTATAAIATSCSGATCDFTGSGSYGGASPSTYAWSVSNGTPPGTGLTYRVVFASAGNYTVNLTTSFDGTSQQGVATRAVTCTQSKGRVKNVTCS